MLSPRALKYIRENEKLLSAEQLLNHLKTAASIEMKEKDFIKQLREHFLPLGIYLHDGFTMVHGHFSTTPILDVRLWNPCSPIQISTEHLSGQVINPDVVANYIRSNWLSSLPVGNIGFLIRRTHADSTGKRAFLFEQTFSGRSGHYLEQAKTNFMNSSLTRLLLKLQNGGAISARFSVSEKYDKLVVSHIFSFEHTEQELEACAQDLGNIKFSYPYHPQQFRP